VDDLNISYCSCKQEGRDVELTPEGTYTCCLCHKEIYIHPGWKSQRHIKTYINTNTQTSCIKPQVNR